MFLFRPHKSTVEESMKEMVELTDKKALIDKIITDLSSFSHNLIIDESTVNITFYCNDERVNWKTYIVTLLGYGVFGFTNAPVE